MSCIKATLDKATQESPITFAEGTMSELSVSQPELMAAVMQLVGMFMGEEFDEEHEHEDEEVSAAFAKEMICMAAFCVLGVTMKAVDATMEAAELSEQWGE